MESQPGFTGAVDAELNAGARNLEMGLGPHLGQAGLYRFQQAIQAKNRGRVEV